MFMGETPLASFFCALVWSVNNMTRFVLLKLAFEGESFVTVSTFELAINVFIRRQLQGTLCRKKFVALAALQLSMLLLEILV